MQTELFKSSGSKKIGSEKLYLEMESDLKNQIKRSAKQQGISVRALVLHILRTHFEGQETKVFQMEFPECVHVEYSFSLPKDLFEKAIDVSSATGTPLRELFANAIEKFIDEKENEL